MSAASSMMRMGNNLAAWFYRRTGGRIGGSARGVPVLLLTVPGRKSGKPRTVPVAYFEADGSYLVAATAGGAKADPQWIRNLAATDRARIQIGADEHEVAARIAGGDERDRLWREVVVAKAPGFAKYEDKSGRVIPVAVLNVVD